MSFGRFRVDAMVASYDLLVIGGGIAGAVLGRAMAQSGARVLILEKQLEFRDRIRGEVLLPWGSVEAKFLEIYDIMLAKCGREAPRERFYYEGKPLEARDFQSSTPRGTCVLSFFHPKMQEVLLDEAGKAGAEVWRGASLKELHVKDRVTAVIIRNADSVTINARLAVGADGRESQLAKKLQFKRMRDPEELYTVGFQISCEIELDAALHFFLHGISGRGSIIIQNNPNNYRVYLLHHKDAISRRLSGDRDYQTAICHLREIGVPETWLDRSTPHGILASFDGAHRWIIEPARESCVLIGDAAGASDPVWGNGLSRTLRDVRLLRDRLLDDENWNNAIRAYAADHDDFFHRLRRVERLNSAMYFGMGSEAESRRIRALEMMEKDPLLYPDVPALGPEARVSEQLTAIFDGTSSNAM